MLDVYWLLRVCIRTVEHADHTGSLFAFAPEFYLNVAMNAYSALKNYFSPANSMDDLPGSVTPPPRWWSSHRTGEAAIAPGTHHRNGGV